MQSCDVLVVGAGPSGSVCSAILNKAGLKTQVIDKERMPRFVIGESLLSNCLTYLERAGMLDAVSRAGYQYKNGAAFSWGERYTYFDFCDKSTAGHGTAFEVKRAEFDKLLIDEAQKQGVPVEFERELTGVEFSTDGVLASTNKGEISAKFIVDASGYGRVLPRLLDLEKPSALAVRKAFFTHIEDRISEPLYDRDKILITTHPSMREVWIWLIPFSDGRCSIGVVGEPRFIDVAGADEITTLKQHVYECPMLARLLKDAVWDTPARQILGYSKDVKALFGERFVLLGNATEFLDPVFSSGVTIALHSAVRAADCVIRQLGGEAVDWQRDYADDLMLGVNAFRTYVNGWYSGVFQDVIYAKNKSHAIKRQICSILAGYAWDRDNPYVTRSDEALQAVHSYI